MRYRINLSVLAVLLISSLALPPIEASAQNIKHYPDGTVVVSDYEVLPQPGASHSRPSFHPNVRHKHKHRHRHSGSRSHFSKSRSLTSSSSSSRGKISAYSRRMGGVTVTRHADGTVDVVDNTMSSRPSAYSPARSPAGHISAGHSSAGHSPAGHSPVANSSASRLDNGVAITRHQDGTVEVQDTALFTPNTR